MKTKSSSSVNPLDKQEADMKEGDEKFFSQSSLPNIDVLAFWKWSSSNLLINTTRGILAEFLVASSLNLTDDPRFVWSNYDLITQSKVKIEVKSASIYQAWKQKGPSPIKFTIAKKYEWDEETGEYSHEPTRSAHIYVFCILWGIEPLKLDNWDFYVLPTDYINEKYGDQKTVSLTSLERQFPELIKRRPLRFDQLNCAIKSTARNIRLRCENRTKTA